MMIRNILVSFLGLMFSTAVFAANCTVLNGGTWSGTFPDVKTEACYQSSGTAGTTTNPNDFTMTLKVGASSDNILYPMTVIFAPTDWEHAHPKCFMLNKDTFYFEAKVSGLKIPIIMTSDNITATSTAKPKQIGIAYQFRKGDGSMVTCKGILTLK